MFNKLTNREVTGWYRTINGAYKKGSDAGYSDEILDEFSSLLDDLYDLYQSR